MWSCPLETMYLSSEVNLAQVTWSKCAFYIVWINCAYPLLMFQNRMSFIWVETMVVSDQERSMLLMRTGHWARTCWPVAMFQVRMVLSFEADMRLFWL